MICLLKILKTANNNYCRISDLTQNSTLDSSLSVKFRMTVIELGCHGLSEQLHRLSYKNSGQSIYTLTMVNCMVSRIKKLLDGKMMLYIGTIKS